MKLDGSAPLASVKCSPRVWSDLLLKDKEMQHLEKKKRRYPRAVLEIKNKLMYRKVLLNPKVRFADDAKD